MLIAKRLIALAMVVALPFPMVAQERTPPSVSVTGRGMVDVAPDRAAVQIGVEREAETARTAQGAASDIASAILEAVGELGVPAERIQTSRLDLFPVYERDREAPGEPEVRGYRAAVMVNVELTDLDLVGRVIDAAIGEGANRVAGVSFDLSDDSAARADALAAAVGDARSKAERIADALEVELGPVLDVVEQGAGVPLPQQTARFEMAVASDSATPVNPGMIRIVATVLVRYAIDEGEPDC